MKDAAKLRDLLKEVLLVYGTPQDAIMMTIGYIEGLKATEALKSKEAS